MTKLSKARVCSAKRRQRLRHAPRSGIVPRELLAFDVLSGVHTERAQRDSGPQADDLVVRVLACAAEERREAIVIALEGVEGPLDAIAAHRVRRIYVLVQEAVRRQREPAVRVAAVAECVGLAEPCLDLVGGEIDELSLPRGIACEIDQGFRGGGCAHVRDRVVQGRRHTGRSTHRPAPLNRRSETGSPSRSSLSIGRLS